MPIVYPALLGPLCSTDSGVTSAAEVGKQLRARSGFYTTALAPTGLKPLTLGTNIRLLTTARSVYPQAALAPGVVTQSTRAMCA